MNRMNRNAFYKWGILFLALCALVQSAAVERAQAAQTPPPTFQAPLAYIGTDGNVYVITSGAAQGTAYTQDANVSSAQVTHQYTHPRWSPDGTKLAFQDRVTGNLFVDAAGQPTHVIATKVNTQYPPAWQPDSSAVVYVVDTQTPTPGNTALSYVQDVQQIAPDGTQPHTLGAFNEQEGCGGGGLDAAGVLYANETSLSGSGLAFAWTKNGWLYSVRCTGAGLGLLNFNNQVQWQVDNIGRATVTRSGTNVAAIVLDQTLKATSLVTLDLATGHTTPINAANNVDQISWSADETTLFYSTLDNTANLPKVGLWKISTQAGSTTSQLFGDQGRYIGQIVSSPDSQSVIFSLIPGDATPQEQILSVPATAAASGMATLANASVIAQGGAPTFGINAGVPAQATTNANPAPTVTAVAAACTVRADWQYTYTVVAGDTLSGIARRAGTTVAILSAGNCLNNANTILSGQVLRVPIAVQAAVATGTKRIEFQPGAVAAAVGGQLAPNTGDTWVIRALGGQTLSAQVVLSSGQGSLTVSGANGTVLQADNSGASSFSGVLPSTQDYYIGVRNTQNVTVNYTLTVSASPVAGPPVAPPTARRRIQFQPGTFTTAVQSQIAANGTDNWVIRASAGQTLTAQTAFASGQAVLIVYGADGNVLQTDHVGSSSFSGVLPSTQDYYIDVRNIQNAVANYTLTVSVPPLGGAPVAPPAALRRIQFQPGTFTAAVQSQLAASGVDNWVIRASGGQTLTAQLAVSSGQALLVVYGADGTVLLTDHAGASSFTGVLPSTQDYYIVVESYPSSATSYVLTVSVPPLS